MKRDDDRKMNGDLLLAPWRMRAYCKAIMGWDFIDLVLRRLG
jgi:hypothetical protein